MKATELAKMAKMLIDDIEESVGRYSYAKDRHGNASAGININIYDSRESINRRIVVARQLLNKLRKEV